MDILKGLLPVLMLMTACAQSTDYIKYEYGFFLGLDSNDISVMEKYRIIVLDAQYYSKSDIQLLKQSGHTVISYINLGALENFRQYYDTYEKYTLDVYENWEEEKWVDVTESDWQDYMSDLSQELMNKGCDGLFVDNVDVYYHYHTEDVFYGITDILSGFKAKGAYVSINGGDVYVSEYIKKYGNLDIIDAVNQETVFSSIDFDTETFHTNNKDEREYFTEYIGNVSSFGKDIYLLEYSTDKKLIKEIEMFCIDKGYTYYVSQTLELLKPSDFGSQAVKNNK